jgi:DNA polymerase-1
MKKLYLVDGSGFIFRAYHALPPLLNPKGIPVGAVFGFSNMLGRLLQSIQDNYITVVFDAGRKTFRQEIYADYKAHRPDAPEDLIPQFSIIRDACDAFGVKRIELEGFEADDIIATYVEEAKLKGLEVIIVSSDKDLMQLISTNVSMFDPIKNKILKEEDVVEKFGVLPSLVIDVQALAGDSSDNVPGVQGIGIKTAAELINTYGGLEALYEVVENIKQPKRRESLINCRELAFISKQLVTLKKDVSLPCLLDDLFIKNDQQNNQNHFFKKHGFTSLIERFSAKLPQNIEKQAEEKDQTFTDVDSEMISFIRAQPEIIQTEERLLLFINEIYKNQIVAIDTETTSLSIQDAKLVGISLSIKDKSVYIPIGHVFGKQLSLDFIKEMLIPVLLDASILKIGHNLKYDLGVLKKYGILVDTVDDTLLLSYVLNGNKHLHNLDELSRIYLHHETIKYEDVTGKGKNQLTFDQVDIEKAADYAAEDAQVTYALWQIFKPKIIQNHQSTLYERAERPMVFVCEKMESNGVLIDESVLDELSVDFNKRLHFLECDIFQKVGKTFNIASPKQLGAILFEDLKLPGGKKTKLGAYSTDNDTLEMLCDQGYEVPKLVQEWRSIAKLQSTYVDGLKENISKVTGRVHTRFSLTAANTGRLASTNPNLQNIPIRTEEGKKIRNAFIASDGFYLLSLDYSQIELRLLAHMANITPLIEAFRKGQDIHKITASQIFNTTLDDVTNDQRQKAKTINFGIIYGISAFGLAKQIHTSRSEAGTIIQHYFNQYPGIQDYMENQKEFARKHGYVETLFKRKCYTQGILDKNASLRQFAERQAINAPLQGTNADLLKMAMADIQKIIEQKKLNSRMILTVHDEILFEIDLLEKEIAPSLFKKAMEQVVFLNIPLKVDQSFGKSWGAF